MVKTHIFLVALSAMFFLFMFAGTASAAWTGTYHLGQEWVKIWIRKDGTIDLFYNISITLDSGDDINYVNVGQPQGDFTRGPALDQYGVTLQTTDASSGNEYKVRVTLQSPLKEGQTIWFTLMTNVAHMIFEDNQTNVGVQFIPSWFEGGKVRDLRVSIVLPVGVNTTMVGTSVPWNGAPQEPDGRWSVFWQRQNLEPTKQYYYEHANFGVSFPKQYVEKYETQPSGVTAFLQQYGAPLLVFGVVVFAIGTVAVVIRKRPYLLPTVSMETLGVRHGFTAVEASYVLDLKPTAIVTEILYSLLQKRAVWVESAYPSVKLRIMPQYENKVGPDDAPLRYYEIDFLNALRDDGSLDEEKLAQAVISVRETAEEKMRGYCRRDTIDYYKKVVDKAWTQVEQAGTPELASNAYDEQLLWLFLDPNYKSRTETAFRDRIFEPSPLWWWYWYGYHHYHPRPTYTPNIEAPTEAAKPPTIPGADFANNIATAVENTSNNIVINLEKFANAIVPAAAAPKASSKPARHGASCVCVCAACACACACVSCACACAGGGVG